MKKKMPGLTEMCSVCSSPAAPQMHYGAIVCFSCRAFFRRAIHRKFECVYKGAKDCLWALDPRTRTWCKKCRFDKCLEAGMKTYLVDRNLKFQNEKKKEKVVIQVPKTLYKCPSDSCEYYSSYYEEISVHVTSKHSIQTPNPPFQNIQETLFHDPITNLKITKYISVPKPAPKETLVIEEANQSDSLVCKYCAHQALNPLDLKYHLMDHLDAGEVSKEDVLTFLHGCQQCNYVASNRDSLNLHYHLIHSSKSSSVSTEGEKDKTFSNFKCALCNFGANYEDDVKIHFETQHNSTSSNSTHQVTVDETDGAESESDAKNHFKGQHYNQTTLDEVDEAEFDEICAEEQF